MQKVSKFHLAWAACFLAGFAMLLYKCPYGFAHMDEAFYLTIPYRMIQGDAMILNEWHLTQLPSFLLVPFVKAWLLFTGSTEGIILAARYLYTVLHGITTVYLYRKLRTRKLAAFLGSLLYLFFAHNAIMALSYHSMGVAFLLVACLLLWENREQKPGICFAAGVLFAGAVLCCPYLLLLYALYLLGCIAVRDRKIWKGFGFFTLACGLCAAAFLAFVLYRCPPARLMEVLPRILHDPEHPGRSFVTVVLDYLKALSYHSAIAVPALAGAAVLFGVILLDKGRQKREGLYLLGAAAVTALYASQFVLHSNHLNFTMFSLSFPGIFCFALRPRELLREMVFLWIPGIVFGFCLSWASNQGIFVIANAGVLSSIASMMMLSKFTVPRRSFAALSRCLIILLMAATVLWAGFRRYENLFWEHGSTMADMTARISVGSEKGILTTPGRKEAYESEYHAATPVREYDGQQVLYYTASVWQYLDDPKTSSSFSAWTSGLHTGTAEKLISYYGINPDKLPDIAWCDRQALADSPNLAAFLEEQGYTREETGQAILYTR